MVIITNADFEIYEIILFNILGCIAMFDNFFFNVYNSIFFLNLEDLTDSTESRISTSVNPCNIRICTRIWNLIYPIVEKITLLALILTQLT